MATIHVLQCHIANDINGNIEVLKSKLLETLEHVDGEIWMTPNAEFGTKSVDIILVGYLKYYGSEKKNYSFVTTVEVKHHCIDQLYVEENKIYAKYSDYVKCINEDVLTHKHLVNKTLSKVFKNTPHVSSLIWLDKIVEGDLPSIDSPDIIAADFSAESLLNKIIREATHSEEEITAISKMLCKEN